MLGIKQLQIVDFLADARKDDGNFELAAKREHKTALCSTVQLGQHNAVQLDRLVEDLRLTHRVLPRRRVKNKVL